MAQTYRVSGTLHHGVLEPDETGKLVSVTHTYHDGDEFSTDDPALEKELRAVKTILLPEEYAGAALSEGNKAPAEQLAAERVAKDEEIARLRAEVEALHAARLASGETSEGDAPKSDEGTGDQGE